MKHERTVSVLVFEEGSQWVAVGLEFFLAAQGATPKEALENFVQITAAQVFVDLKRDLIPLDDFDMAPDDYWDRVGTVYPW